jgi:hypothetical protein
VKKVLYFIISILLVVVIFFSGMLVNINTQNSLEKVTEDVAQQATTTSSDTAYITMAEHLAELSGTCRVLETGTVTTGTMQGGTVQYLTVNLQNTYTTSDNARFFICGSELISGTNFAVYVAMMGGRVVDNSYSFYIMNNAASSRSGSVKLYYFVISNVV